MKYHSQLRIRSGKTQPKGYAQVHAGVFPLTWLQKGNQVASDNEKNNRQTFLLAVSETPLTAGSLSP